MSDIAGSVFVLLFGPILLVLTPLVAVVGWACGRIGTRTIAPAGVATIIVLVVLVVLVIAVAMFWAMGVQVACARCKLTSDQVAGLLALG